METDKHAGEDVEVIEFDEEVSDNSDSDDGGGELSFDPGKDLWVTVTVNKSGHKALDVEEAWNWEVMNIIYFFFFIFGIFFGGVAYLPFQKSPSFFRSSSF